MGHFVDISNPKYYAYAIGLVQTQYYFNDKDLKEEKGEA